MSEWIVHRKWFHYVLMREVYADFFGAGYIYYRNSRNRVVRFFNKDAAYDASDALNREQENDYRM